MMKALKPDLSQAINKQAHLLAVQSFASIRMALEEKAREMLKAGKDGNETVRAIRLAVLQPVEVEL